jgi:hypothetical protein
MKVTNSFAISILAMLLALLSGYLKLGTEAVIASIAATYILGRASQKVGIGIAVSKDPNSSTSDIIDKIKD